MYREAILIFSRKYMRRACMRKRVVRSSWWWWGCAGGFGWGFPWILASIQQLSGYQWWTETSQRMVTVHSPLCLLVHFSRVVYTIQFIWFLFRLQSAAEIGWRYSILPCSGNHSSRNRLPSHSHSIKEVRCFPICFIYLCTYILCMIRVLTIRLCAFSHTDHMTKRLTRRLTTPEFAQYAWKIENLARGYVLFLVCISSTWSALTDGSKWVPHVPCASSRCCRFD